jgi:hypothetical protein
MAIDDMTLRDRTAGLMRGNRQQMQLGYSARNAAYAALRYDFSGEDPGFDDPRLTEDLFPYAEGFADGMADVLERSVMRSEWLAQGESYVRHTDDPDYVRTNAYEAGRDLAQWEHAPSLYPALERKPRPDYIQRFPERTAS